MKALRLEPFTAFGDLLFSLDAEAVVTQLGPPRHHGRNEAELNEYDYGHCVLRFQDNGRLEEITRRAPLLQLGTVAIPFAALGSFVLTQDAEAFERAGFLVSPALGIAFVPEQPDWVTALARHCIATWRSLGQR